MVKRLLPPERMQAPKHIIPLHTVTHRYRRPRTSRPSHRHIPVTHTVTYRYTPLQAAKDISAIAERTEGYSGSDITLVCKEAAMRPLRRLLGTIESQQHDPHARPPQPGDAHAACLLVRPPDHRPARRRVRPFSAAPTTANGPDCLDFPPAPARPLIISSSHHLIISSARHRVIDPIRHSLPAAFRSCSGPVLTEDCESALAAVRPTVSSLAERYAEWEREFGSI